MTTDIVFSRNGKALTTSRLVAQAFNKEHFHVLRSIRQLDCSDEFRAANFQLSYYYDIMPTGGKRKYPIYYIKKDGITMLVMGFTGSDIVSVKEEYIRWLNGITIKPSYIIHDTLFKQLFRKLAR